MINRKYKTVRQLDERDCGAACISTILKYYGIKMSIAKIRFLANTNYNGTTGKGIIKAFNNLGFLTHGFKTDCLKDLKNIRYPIIANVKKGDSYHFVVLFKMYKNYFIIGDPDVGTIKMNIQDFVNISTGLYLCIEKKYIVKQENESNFLTFIKHILKRNLIYIIIISFLSILIAFTSYIVSYFYQILIDEVLPHSNVELLIIASIGFIIIYIIKFIYDYIRQFLVLKLSKRIDIYMMSNLYDCIVNLPIEYYTGRKTGEISSRFSDSQNIRNLLSNTIITIFLDIVIVLIGCVFLIRINIILFFITFLEIGICLLLTIIFKKKSINYNRSMMHTNSLLESQLIENIKGYEKIKAYNLQKIQVEELNRKLKKYTDITVNYGNWISLQLLSQELTKNVFCILLLSIGGYLVLQNELTLGQLLAFFTLVNYFLNPILNLFQVIPNIQNAYVSFERLTDILDYEKEKLYVGEKLDEKDIDIKIRNLSFSYDLDNYVLKNINLDIKSNCKIGLVGKSGSGKTTLAKLIMRFYDSYDGKIIINGHEISYYSIESLRNQIGYISQTPFLFEGTIMDNLKKCAQKSISDKEIISMCEMIGIDEYIQNLPNKYQTVIAENGNSLSGGQKQKLVLVQALLKKPKLLILDEATSNLDTISEEQINNVIDLLKDMTVFVISHRLSIIEKCEKIYVMDDTGIKECGNHKELLQNKGIYYKMWQEKNINNK